MVANDADDAIVVTTEIGDDDDGLIIQRLRPSTKYGRS